MADEQKGGAVLAAICSLGRSLGFRVAGQGVETIDHAQLLRAAGCSEAQGYYFAPPMPLEAVLQMESESETRSSRRALSGTRARISHVTSSCPGLTGHPFRLVCIGRHRWMPDQVRPEDERG